MLDMLGKVQNKIENRSKEVSHEIKQEHMVKDHLQEIMKEIEQHSQDIADESQEDFREQLENEITDHVNNLLGDKYDTDDIQHLDIKKLKNIDGEQIKELENLQQMVKSLRGIDTKYQNDTSHIAEELIEALDNTKNDELTKAELSINDRIKKIVDELHAKGVRKLTLKEETDLIERLL